MTLPEPAIGAPVQPALFGPATERLPLGPDAWLLQGFAATWADALMRAIDGVLQHAPLRHMSTARGWRMSVATSNCGALGWLSDARGYRYDAIDPETGLHWPRCPPRSANWPSAPPRRPVSPRSNPMPA